jgi:hypothetical protein
VAERGEARQIEEAAIAFDGVDEAENLVEPLRSSGAASHATISPPNAWSMSRVSAMKSLIRSSMIPCRRWRRGLMAFGW